MSKIITGTVDLGRIELEESTEEVEETTEEVEENNNDDQR